jgi:adhesin/invasin
MSMVMNGANGQTVHVGTPVNLPPSVLVTDANNNPVPGTAVNFLVNSGGGSVTGGAATTNAAGIATVGSWTLGTTAGINTLNATNASLTGSPVQFTATGLVGDPAIIVINGGNNQSVAAGSPVPIAPSVRVTDQYNNNVQGVAVTFTPAAGSGSVTTTSTTTNSGGVATCGSWTLGTTAGTDTMTVTSLGLSGSPLTFTATGTAGPATKYVVSSSSYSPAIGSPVTITAQLTDQYNNPVAAGGLLVTFTKNQTSGSFSGANPALTGANGAATITLTMGMTVGTPYNVVATTATPTPAKTGTSPVITTVAATPTRIAMNTGNNQSATVNTAVATAPSALVTDAYNNPVSGVVVTFAVATGGGSVTGASATTNAAGIATVGSWVLGTTAGANTLTASCTGLTGSPVTFTATGTAGPATRYVVTSSSYSPAAGSTISLTAQLADQYGNAVATSGIRVTFSKTGTGGRFSSTRVNTNASGIATTTFTTSRTVGRVYTFTARSTSGGTRTGTSAAVTTVAGAPTRISLYAGSGQTATVGTAVATAPSVRVRDASGNNCPGVVVTFAVTAGGGSITTASATTNTSGIASCGAWTLGTTAGANTVTATCAGLTGSPVTFTATGVAGSATRMTLSAGSGQTATVGTAVATAPRVLVTDAYGNPVPGVAVTFAVASGGGSVIGGAATTNASGLATVGSWTLGTAPGANTLTATRAGLTGSPVTFTATGLAGAATKYVVTSSSYAPVAGTAVTITAQLADQYNNAVATAGIAVTFTKTGTGGTLGTPNPATTNASGVATIVFTTQATVGRVYTVTATSTVPSMRTGTSATITTR